MAYFILHSVLASAWAKRLFGQWQHYRLFYTAMAMLTLAPLWLLRASLPFEPLWNGGIVGQVIGLGFGFGAYKMGAAALRLYGIRQFVGLKPQTAETLVRKGILARVRHPLYTATILLGIGFFIWQPIWANLVMLLAWLAYLPIGIWLEERKLIAQFGAAYQTYQKEVPALWPRIPFAKWK